ncbi:hypothetical protein BCR32DRAFT_267172 [Anaeromyces robustus]|uniref:poly(ADP-ribose) glycohydrolase n=1 Tax=Anaeromyces robustus TaxID=1754192 RepID=A0A1Y1XCH6_9FUNG|nr:hypothetical protein BCR32DRAFT_267172 [Anaeromyces robustus]|eukprot:ORX83136.1 hypothetical protein BCR32DRAFT_267172 [Anaeromyces robustus]
MYNQIYNNNYNPNRNKNRPNGKKYVQTKLNFGQKPLDNYEDDPTLLDYNFGNIMLSQNELNVSDELKTHLHYIRIPYYENNNPEKLNEKKYNIIKEALTKFPIRNCNAFQYALLKYHTELSENDNSLLNNLRLYEKRYSDEAKYFFIEILPFIIEQALKLPEYLTKPIPLLGKYMNIAITFNKLQVISLLANQFLCIFTEENNKLYHTPECSFLGIFSTPKSTVDSSVEKIRSVVHYFDKMRKRSIDSLKSELLTFQRVSLKEKSLPDWINSSMNICNVIIDKGRNIEECENMLQVDFANSYLGGGVLRTGCVQEEIRFVITPELFVSMIFTQKLDNLETAFIIGAERVSKFKGYGRSFKFNGDHNDCYIKYDKWNRKSTEIVALDATHYSPSLKKYIQFSTKETIREMNKLYVGFKNNELSNLSEGSYIATGNWGCGAYNGDLELKAMLQVLVASITEKNICYCPFDKVEFADRLGVVVHSLKTHNVTTDLLYKLIRSYNTEVIFKHVNHNSPPKISLFDYILGTLQYN